MHLVKNPARCSQRSATSNYKCIPLNIIYEMQMSLISLRELSRGLCARSAILTHNPAKLGLRGRGLKGALVAATIHNICIYIYIIGIYIIICCLVKLTDLISKLIVHVLIIHDLYLSVLKCVYREKQ